MKTLREVFKEKLFVYIQQPHKGKQMTLWVDGSTPKQNTSCARTPKCILRAPPRTPAADSGECDVGSNPRADLQGR